MPDETILEPQKVTIFFGRKSPREQYGSAEASIHLQVPTELGDDSDTLAAKIVETFAAAKLEVYKQLAIDTNVDPLTNVVIETASRVLGATPVSTPSAQPTEAFVPNTAYESMSKPDQKAFCKADVAANPNDWFDNTQDKRNPKAPDYKSKRTNTRVPDGTGFWL